MRAIGRILRIAAALAVVLVLILVGVVGAGLLYLRSEPGRQTLARMISDAASDPAGMRVTIGGVGEGLPLRLAVEDVVLADPAGPWLTVESFVVTWAPAALLSARLHVTDARATGVRLARLPESAAEEPPPPGEAGGPLMPELPLGIRVDRLVIDAVTIDEALAGETVRLRAVGRFAAEVGDRVRSDLSIERLDGAGGKIVFEAAFDPAAETLSLDAEGAEPAGGLAGRLLGLEPAPPLSLSLAGEGPLADWHGRLAAAAEGVAAIEAVLALEEARRLKAVGEADIAALLAPDLRPVVGERLAFELALEAADEAVTLERAVVETAAAAAAASGRIDTETGDLAAEAVITLTDPARIAPLLAPAGVEGARVEIDVGGTTAAPSVAMRGLVARLRLPEGRVNTVELAVTAAPRPGSSSLFEIAGELRLRGIDGVAEEAAVVLGEEALLTFAGEADAAGPGMSLDSVTVTTAAARLAGRAAYAFATGEVTASATVTVDDLGALSPLAGQALSGSALLTAAVGGSVDAMRLDGQVAIGLAGARFGEAVIDAFVGAEPSLSTAFALDGEDRLSLDEITLDAEHVSLQGQVRLSEGLQTVDGAARARIASLAPLAASVGEPVDGSLTLDVAASGPVADPAVRADLASPEVSVAGIAIRTVEARLNATSVASAPAGELRVAARTPYGPASLSTAFAVEGADRVRLRDLSLSGAGLALSGEVAVPFGAAPYEGRIAGRWAPGPGGLAVAGQTLAGQASIDARLLGQNGRQGLELDVDARGLAIAADGASVARAGRLAVRGAIADALGSPVLRISANGEAIEAGGVAVETLTADVSGALENATFTVAAAGSGEPAFDVAAAGTFGVAAGLTRIDLATLDSRAGRHTLRLRQPARIAIAADRYQVEGLALAVDDGTLTADARLGGAASSARIAAAGIPLGLVDVVAPEVALGGSLDADIDLGTEAGLLAGRVQMSISNLAEAAEGLASAPPLDVSADATWAGGTIAADARIGVLGENDLLADARIPLAVDARTLAVRSRPDAPLSGSVRWQGDVGPLAEALPLDEHRLTGPGRIALDVAGTLAAPEVTGEVVLDGASYEHLTMGTLIRDLDARIEAGRGRLVRIEATGTDGGTGTVTARGRIDLADLNAMDIDIEAAVQRATLVRRDDVTATATGEVQFVDTAGGGKIAGRIETDEVRLRLVDRLPPSVVNLEVVEIRTDADAAAEGERQPQADEGLDLDLTISMPRRVFVSGRGLDSEWGGELRVTGTTEEPRIVGTITAIRGRFLFGNREFVLTKGAIDFTGGREIDPRLDIVLEYAGSNVTAILGVSGPASNPEIDIGSREGIPRSEVLPRALFGKSAAEMTAGEALELAAALDGLRGGSSLTGNIVGRTREAIGVDVLSVDAGLGGEGPSLRAGRYLTEDIYVETRQGTSPGTTRYRAEFRITPQISAETEFGDPTSSTSGSIGLKWQLDY